MENHAWLTRELERHLPRLIEAPGAVRNRVASLYLDTDDFQLYSDAVRAPEHRSLLRLRTYNHEGEIFAELKQRAGTASLKRRVQVPGLSSLARPWAALEQAAAS